MMPQGRSNFSHSLNQSSGQSYSKRSDTESSDEIILTKLSRNGAHGSPTSYQGILGGGELPHRVPPTLTSMAHSKGMEHHSTPGSTSRLPSLGVTPKIHRTAGRESIVQGSTSPEMMEAIREQHSKARRREQARRHLSNSLSGSRTVLPMLRRTQSVSVPAHLNGCQHGTCWHPLKCAGTFRRETSSLGHKPVQDGLMCSQGMGLRRTRSLKEDRSGTHPLSLSLPLPQPSRPVDLAALVHELNAGVHYTPFRRDSRDLSISDCDELDDSASNNIDAQDDILDPDLFPRRARPEENSVSTRTLTPALRKLNRRRMSSRVRTQQWVNQVEAKAGRDSKNDARITKENACISLIFEQEI